MRAVPFRRTAPSGLTGGADGNILVGGRAGHVHAEHARRERADCLGLRAAADKQNAGNLSAKRTDKL